MKVHELKTVNPFFNAVRMREKRFELRKNDRDFTAGDILVLRLWDNASKVFVGPNCVVRVNYVLYQFVGLQQGYCILSISDPI